MSNDNKQKRNNTKYSGCHLYVFTTECKSGIKKLLRSATNGKGLISHFHLQYFVTELLDLYIISYLSQES